jgi:hypothetical protein
MTTGKFLAMLDHLFIIIPHMARGAHHLLAGNEKRFYFQRLFTKCLKIDIMLIEQSL